MADRTQFSIANEYVRMGRLREALQIFARLVNSRIGFRPYEMNYVLTKRMIEEPTLGDSAMPFRRVRSVTHPESSPYAEGASCKFVVVTPAYNAEKFIDQTINSVITQKGDFFIDYIIKDACSGDSTVQIVESIQKQIAESKRPLCCNGLTLSLDSSPDQGMYDAVHVGFQEGSLTPSPADILTYLNADDIYEPNAFQIAKTVFAETKAQWICGQNRTINEHGDTLNLVSFPLSYAKEDIVRGLHLSGGNLYFIQQEGTFWTRGLYDQVGGLNRKMKLAGDFDLWLRFAKVAELLAMDRPMASFRARAGQLSESFFRYRDEIEKFGLPTGDHLKNAHHSKESLGLMGTKGPELANQQAPGPVCFLNDDLSIREVVYMKSAWVKGENI
jgi:glycosyltransferase involved in cell wall biosynthesis